MKKNLSFPLILLLVIFILSGCYTIVRAPKTEEDIISQNQYNDEYYQDYDNYYQNYSFTDPDLLPYNMDYYRNSLYYRYRDFLYSRLWDDYSSFDPYDRYNPYWDSPWSNCYSPCGYGYNYPYSAYSPYYGYYSYGSSNYNSNSSKSSKDSKPKQGRMQQYRYREIKYPSSFNFQNNLNLPMTAVSSTSDKSSNKSDKKTNSSKKQKNKPALDNSSKSSGYPSSHSSSSFSRPSRSSSSSSRSSRSSSSSVSRSSSSNRSSSSRTSRSSSSRSRKKK